MRSLLLLLILSATLISILDAVGAQNPQNRQTSPSTAANPNFGHSNWDLWRDKDAGKTRAKRYYWWRRSYHYYNYYPRRRYYNYYSNYYNNYYYYYKKR